MRLAWTSLVIVALVAGVGCTQPVDGRGTAVLDQEQAGGGQDSLRARRPPVSVAECPGQRTDHVSPTPQTAVLTTPGTDAPLLPDESGTLPAGRALSELYYNEPGAPDAFDDAGYVIGFQNSWGVGPAHMSQRRTQRATVFQFEDPAGACAFAEWERTTYGLTPRSDTEVPGALGYVAQPDGAFPGGVELLTTKGEFVIIVVVLDPDAGRRDSAALHMFTDQYERA